MATRAANRGRRIKDFPFSKIHKCKIHPGVGIARVGNSPEEYFIGPEAPRDPREVTAPDGSFKDSKGYIKRQAARFRIYAYDKVGNNLGELPLGKAADQKAGRAAHVVWTVHLANKKGAWFRFFTRFGKPGHIRNPLIPVAKGQPPDSRRSLVIDPGERSIDGDGNPVRRAVGSNTTCFDTGTFLGTTVPLGKLALDECSRLVVLGGLGQSGSTTPNNPIGANSAAVDYWANNDNWYDDISDGPVTAKVTLPNGKMLTINRPEDAAWVIVAPPKYAPGIYPIVSLYDVMREVALDAGWIADHKDLIYYRDILPILERAVGMSWVNQEAQRGHGYDKRGEFRSPRGTARAHGNEKPDRNANPAVRTRINTALLTSRKFKAPEDNKEAREAILLRIRNPLLDETAANRQANSLFMPLLSGDGGDRTVGKGRTWMSVLPSQYRKFVQWRDGNFKTGNKPEFPPLESIVDPDAQVDALQRGALQPCIGGAFFPGIEAPWIVRDACLYVEPFRINSKKHHAGDITKYMCLPWQADFYDCRDTWWPAARPDDVIPEDVFEEANKAWRPGQTKVVEGLEGRVKWDRGLGVTTLFRRPWHNPADAVDDPRESGRRGCDDMVRYWHELGFVVARKTRWLDPGSPESEYVFIETERRPHAGMDVRELFNCLMNMDESRNRTCLPKVEEFVEYVLEAARRLQGTADAFAWMDNIRPFDYNEEVFESRMKDIYDDCADFAFTEKSKNGVRVPYDPTDPEQNPFFRTREAVTERIRQLTPFNFLDGSWLRNIHRVGPVDEVNSILFTILKEELGDGVPSQNHANIYRDLCHSFGFYPPPIQSTAFAYDAAFLDCAFDSPTFQLGISEFSRRYYPEIIGMSLWLEWTVMELHRIASIVEMVGLSSHFYRMHIAIDNAASGHGAAIMRAVKLYLRQVRIDGGEEAVQQHWKRIWDGYVAFSYTFVIVIRQVARILKDPSSLEERLKRLIKEKAPYGQLNHGKRMLGNSSINSFFADPTAFLQALQHYNYIIPGKPDESRFFKALEFRGGPMYHVFTEDEIKLWRDWTLELGEDNRNRQGSSLRTLKERLSSLNAPLVEFVSDAQLSAWQLAAAEHRVALWVEIASKEVLGRAQDQATPGVPTRAQLEAIEGLINDRFATWVGWGMIRAATYVAATYCDQVRGIKASLPDPHTGSNLTIAEWFDRIRNAENSAVPARALLQSLSTELKKRKALMKELFGDGGSLVSAFDSGIPGNDRRRARDMMEAWLEAGCPLPDVSQRRVKPLRMDASLNEEETHPTGLAMGFGTVH